MKNLYKIFFSAAVALATMVGCAESGIEELMVNPDSELTGTFRVAATTPTNETTKVDVDGLSVTWSDTDVIKIAQVGDDGQFVSSYTYYIDEESISDSGKYAEFTGYNLTVGQRYIAYSYPSGGYITTIPACDIIDNFYGSYSYSTFDKENIGIIMQSNIFEYDGVSLPQLSFEHKSSLLELDIQLSDSSTSVCDVTSIEIVASSGDNIFLTFLLFNSYGESVYAFNEGYTYQYGATNSIELELTDAIELSTSSPISMQVPLTWNGSITEADGEFVFTIKTSDGMESSVTKLMQVLEDGVRYSAELIFDEPQDMIANDRAALIDLYNSTDGDNWINNTNWCTDADLSEWYGILTDSNGRVDWLQLSDNNLTGSIPESIGNLTNLVRIHLSNNNLTGSIPESIGNLINLTHLYIYMNNFSTAIPESICNLVYLERLDVRACFVGEIPEDIGNLASLQYLHISGEGITGSIPESIGNLTNLTSLSISCQDMTGSIPESIGNLTNLTSLSLFGKSLTGPIPESIGNLINLEYLYISGGGYYLSSGVGIGQMSGEIPDVFGNMKKLTSLSIACAQFSGSIPYSIGTLTQLESLDLSRNQLEGSVEFLGSLSNLTSISLTNNKFSGTIPDNFGNLSNWNEIAWDMISGQQSGYGFTSFPDVYLDPSTVTTIENKTINTEDFFNYNKLTCVVLWRSWCWWSTYYMETIKDLYNSYASKGFGLISLNDESDLSTITTYVANNSIPGHVCQLSGSGYTDGTNRIKYMPTSASPTYAFVDSNGKIVFSESLYDFDDPTMSREEATIAFMEEYFGEALTETEVYESTDYSSDGEVLTLQTATVGNGIDIVIVGDGFVDTDMEIGGVYETRMSEAMEHFFSEEPYTTYRNRYNVYAVKAVSKNSGVGVNETVFSCQFGEGTHISGDDTTVFEYALKVPSITNTNNLTVISVLNSSNYAGTCYMYGGNDAAVAYCPIIFNDDEYFRQIIIHEAGGHGFAKLLDEYAYTGTIPDDRVAYFNNYEKAWGWGANVDVVSDPSTIQWADLLADSRYSGLVGIYEGSMTYEYGAYRPTDVSIMRYNTGGYNPPSRKEIYRRIMVLSGDTYDYEEFVSYDAINRSVSSQAYSASQAAKVDKSTFVPFAQPVVINGSPEVGK